MYEQLCERIADVGLRRLLWQYLRRTVELGGLFREIEKGISLGCPLSPLIGAICLAPIDEQLTDKDLFYVRYMDGWIVLANTRRHLRKAVKRTNQILSALKLQKHPDKTFVGLVEKGFDFLGYHFSAEGLDVAQSTLNNLVTKATRLYEQSPSAPEGAERVECYLRRWLGWAVGISGNVTVSVIVPDTIATSLQLLVPNKSKQSLTNHWCLRVYANVAT